MPGSRREMSPHAAPRPKTEQIELTDVKMTAPKAAFLAAAIVMAACAVSISAGPGSLHVGDSSCCKRFQHDSIRLILLKRFYHTPTDCKLQAVVLVTKSEKMICADPNKSWVRRAMQHLQKKPQGA
ncbi:C-C motif chemokine 22-like [Ambystoma mexicanum]|uniref:C-C motif chemokine 22-like n=1 Tax=Ambystoma mexicanum TaxID=8296 RepID=UPI0037E98767